jgi:phosphatidylglycerol---prolipoprotein diacylglyceryl transferase
MYALALSFSAAAGAATAMPFFRLGQLDVGIPIQAFGIIVAVGVLIGAGLLRRYAEWHGVSDDHIRGLTGWVTITGFIGAHFFDVLAYQWDDFMEDPLLLIYVWKGISSYGGFLGGAFGWWFYVWWKRLPMRLMADITLIGLLVAFSIGRIGCTVVSDHVGAAVDESKWYSMFAKLGAMDYPRHLNVGNLAKHYPGTSEHITAWNLGLVELLYLIPVNAFILWFAFRKAKPDGNDSKGRPKFTHTYNAGMVTVLVGLLYAPVRFFMEFLRPTDSDPRYVGLTFAQWCSIAAFVAAGVLAMKIAKGGKSAEAITDTSGEAQRRLKMILKEDPREELDTKSATAAAKADEKAAAKKDPKLAKTLPEDDEEAARERAAAKAEAKDEQIRDAKKK